MNVSTIADMLRNDPTIANDVPGFISRMNAKTQPVSVTVVTQTQVVDSFTSTAETHGGPCTPADVAAAQATLTQAVWQDKATALLAGLQSAIAGGQVTSLATLKSVAQTILAGL